MATPRRAPTRRAAPKPRPKVARKPKMAGLETMPGPRSKAPTSRKRAAPRPQIMGGALAPGGGLLARMAQVAAAAARTAPSTVRPTGQAISPWLRRAQEGKLPAKELTVRGGGNSLAGGILASLLGGKTRAVVRSSPKKGTTVPSPTRQVKRMPQKTKLTKRANDYRRTVSANGNRTNRGITTAKPSVRLSARGRVPAKVVPRTNRTITNSTRSRTRPATLKKR